MFYIYEWYIKDTNEIIYVGKGSKKRYLSKQHNNMFKEFIKRFKCESRIIKYFEDEQDAYRREFERINELKQINQCVCNIYDGGNGGGASIKNKMARWTPEERDKYSKNNVMKADKQRERMKKNNPMRNKEYAMKNGQAHAKPIIIGSKEFKSILEASRFYNCATSSIWWYLKTGHKGNEKCYYKYGNQQPSTNLND